MPRTKTILVIKKKFMFHNEVVYLNIDNFLYYFGKQLVIEKWVCKLVNSVRSSFLNVGVMFSNFQFIWEYSCIDNLID